MKASSSCILLVWTTLFCSTSHLSYAQKKQKEPEVINVLMQADQWQFEEGTVEFIQHKGVPAMKLGSRSGVIPLKDVTFENGTIEYDVEPLTEPFAGIYFRRVDDQTSEYFYLRTDRAGKPTANDAVQYAPMTKGALLWDLYDEYQGPADIKAQDWNHIKLVISGAQMRAYVNDSLRLAIPRLEADTDVGELAFIGESIVANLVIKPGAVENLPASPGVDLTNHDANYIRQWKVSAPTALPSGKELILDDLPQSDLTEEIVAERRGLINLSRRFGNNEARRYVWLQASIRSDQAQEKILQLGFSDEVWVFINGKMLYVDKNLYTQNMRKYPNGRISTDNASFSVPLQAGDNQLLIGVANDFYGWGIMARWRDTGGLE